MSSADISNNANPPAKSELAFSVEGMTCQGCARHAREAIEAVPGVASANIQLAEGRAFARLTGSTETTSEQIARAIDAAGYQSEFLSPDTNQNNAEKGANFWGGWRLNVLLGIPATLLFMIAEWGFGVGMERWFHWLGFVIALPVQIICGGKFYRGAWSQLKRGQSNMDTLVSLGSTTAFIYSAWGLFAGWSGHLYFMESVGIITFVSIGHWLETLASARAAGALQALMNLAPERALRLNDNGSEEEINAADLRAGDLVSLKPGDRAPVDGEVTKGESAVDESMLTGESLPVEKRAGDSLYAGTVNENGNLVMRVTATGEGTALARIIEVVDRAQNSRADIQKLGDRVSSVFVPVVIATAIATALWWGLGYESAAAASRWVGQFLWGVTLPDAAMTAAVIHMAAVFIISCPCAMGLATPIAIMAGTNAAAKRGILIRDGEALEKSGSVTDVLFDKTGTLTEGKLAVEAWRVFDVPEEEARLLAAALARPSKHPLSRAVASNVSENAGTELTNWTEHRGRGLEASRDANGQSRQVQLGSLNWLRESNVDVASVDQFAAEWTAQGATVLGLAEDARLIAAIALRDTVKSGAREMISRLIAEGKTPSLVSGDLEAAAKAVAEQLGIPAENVFAEVRPEDKADIVAQLQSKDRRVAFVGDGINDAPALKQADLGIAVTQASDVAREAADIILLRSDIDGIPEALGLARATLRVIKQNLFWAFFYNAAGIPLAALGFLNPMLCAAAMGCSDLVVIGNALRLKWRRN